MKPKGKGNCPNGEGEEPLNLLEIQFFFSFSIEVPLLPAAAPFVPLIQWLGAAESTSLLVFVLLVPRRFKQFEPVL